MSTEAWTPEELDAVLVQVPDHHDPLVPIEVDLAEPPSDLPERLAVLVAEAPKPEGRSEQHYALVAMALTYGLEDGQIAALARSHVPSVQKWGLEGAHRQAGASLAKLRPEHDHAGKDCATAQCPQAPWWMRAPDDADSKEGEPEHSLQYGLLKAKLLTVEQVKNLPPPEPLIAGVLNRRRLGIIWGKPGSGKSFVVLDWALSVATGSWWFGREVTQGLCIYMAAEGADGIGQRLDAWMADRKIYDVPAEQMLVLPDAVNLMDRVWSGALAEVAGDLKPALVIADTLARSMPGGEENTSRDAGVVIEAANRIQQACGATVLFVHHDTREGSNLRGSSALDGAVDTSVECRADGQAITLKSRKQKDMRDFPDLKLWREPVADSCVIYSQERVGVTASRSDAESTLFEAIRECCGSDGLSASELKKVTLQANSTFYRALEALVREGVVVKLGSANRPRYAAHQE